MAIKKDGKDKRWVEMEVILPGTPEEVWKAIATGDGYTAWFVKTKIDERVDGLLHFDLGIMGESTGEVTTWKPPYNFAYVEKSWAEGAPPVATEITITKRKGDTCLVRMVHSLFTSSDAWDDQLEGFEGGWPGFFEVLRIYMTHFRGQAAAPASISKMAPGNDRQAWKTLNQALALDVLSVGDSWQSPRGAPRASGVIEHIKQSDQSRLVVVRLDQPGAGALVVGSFNMGEQFLISLGFYLYGDHGTQRAEKTSSEWQPWFDSTLKV